MRKLVQLMDNFKDTFKSFFALLSGNFLSQIIGFINSAYLARVLGTGEVGIINFAQTFILYFMFLSNLGLSLYCIREENKESNDSLILNIASLKLYLTVISSLMFSIIVLFLHKPFTEIIIILIIGLSLFALGNDVDYLFISKNNMKYISISLVLRNGVWLFLNVVFIHSANDVFLCAMFYTLSIVFSVIYSRTTFNKIYFKLKVLAPLKIDYKILLKARPFALSLFMIQLNNSFDIIFVGLTRNPSEVAIYSSVYKIINFIIAMIIAYNNSAYSKISDLYHNNKDKLSNYIVKYYKFGMMLFLPIMFGGIALSKPILLFVFGDKYEKGYEVFSILLIIISLRMIVSTFSSVLIMGNKSDEFSKSVVIGAVFNVISNMIFIPKYGIIAAATTTVLTELIQGGYIYYHFRKEFKINILSNSYKYIISSVIMYMLLHYINYNVIINIILAIIVYFIVLLLINFKSFIKMVRTKNQSA